MASPAQKRLTLPEFLECDDGTDRRYELLDGVPVMMAPSLEAHGELAAVLAMEIGSRVKPPCRVINEAGIVISDRADTYYVADLAVTCAPRDPGRRMVVEPVLAVEVLSPSTGQVDRWRVEDLIGNAQIRLCCCNAPIPLGAIYRDLIPDGA
jgi:Uma2 family endonuclease